MNIAQALADPTLAQIERDIRRIAKEAWEDDAGDWMTVGSAERGGDMRATRTGGQIFFGRALMTLRDRDEGRYLPFYDQERDLEVMRSRIRRLFVRTSVPIGALTAVQVYTMGGEWEYKIEPKMVAGEQSQVPPDLLRELQIVLDAIREKNDFENWLQDDIHNYSRENGEAPVAGYASPDGICDLRRWECDTLREPREVQRLGRWLNCDPRRSSWTFGVHTLYDPRMRRVDHERHAGYHLCFTDNGSDWDYLPAWPQATGDDDLDGKFLHLVKRNTPRGAKRGISDFFPILGDIEREDRLVENLSVGAAILAAIAYFETLPKGTNKDAAESSLSRNLNAFARALTDKRGGERNIQAIRPGTVISNNNGRDITVGPLGELRQPIYIEVSQHMLRRIGLRWNFPEYMISGDASNANFSSTLVAESPFVKARKADQGAYAAEFKLILWKALKLAVDAGRFGRWNLSFAMLNKLVDISIKPPMVESRDKQAQIEELKMLWEAQLIYGNEVRTDLGREPKPEFEEKLGAGTPLVIGPMAGLPQPGQQPGQGMNAGQPGQGQQPPNAPPHNPQQQPPNAGQPPVQKPNPFQQQQPPPQSREDQTRLAAYGGAIAKARTAREARAIGRRILRGE